MREKKKRQRKEEKSHFYVSLMTKSLSAYSHKINQVYNEDRSKPFVSLL